MKYKDSQTSVLLETARLYYEHGFSQLQIARKLGISRPGISRLLQRARQEGIVRIEIRDPADIGIHLEVQLREQFNLRRAVVVPNHDSTSVIKKRLGTAAVSLLTDLVKPGLILGISWGSTMQEVAQQMPSRPTKDVILVQLNGGVSRAEYDTHASEIAQKLGERYRAVPYLLPLPAIVDSAEVKNVITSDKNIARTLKLAQKASIAMCTIGSFKFDSVLVKADYFETEEVRSLLDKGAVADICSRIIDHQGNICSKELDGRTIGISLDDLRNKEYAIAVAGGHEKLSAIRAGLRSGIFNVLVTDEWTAGELLGTEN